MFLQFVFLALALVYQIETYANELPIIVSDQQGNPKELPSVSLSDLGEVLVDFRDGRIVTLSRPETTFERSLVLEAEVVDNTCVPNFRRVKCTYSAHFVQEVLLTTWYRHNDSTKKYQYLIDGQNDDEAFPIMDFNNIWLWENKKLSSVSSVFTSGISPWSGDYKKMLKNPILTCESMSWAHQTFGKQNGEVVIDEWTVESNETNPETKLNENLMARTYLDIKAELKANRLEITDVGFTPRMKSIFNSLSGFSLGDIIGWSLLKGDRTCEVSLKIDRATFLNELLESFQPTGNSTLQSVKGVKNLEFASQITLTDSESEIASYSEEIINIKGKELYDNLRLIEFLGIADVYPTTSNGVFDSIQVIFGDLK